MLPPELRVMSLAPRRSLNAETSSRSAGRGERVDLRAWQRRVPPRRCCATRLVTRSHPTAMKATNTSWCSTEPSKTSGALPDWHAGSERAGHSAQRVESRRLSRTRDLGKARYVFVAAHPTSSAPAFAYFARFRAGSVARPAKRHVCVASATQFGNGSAPMKRALREAADASASRRDRSFHWMRRL